MLMLRMDCFHLVNEESYVKVYAQLSRSGTLTSSMTVKLSLGNHTIRPFRPSFIDLALNER